MYVPVHLTTPQQTSRDAKPHLHDASKQGAHIAGLVPPSKVNTGHRTTSQVHYRIEHQPGKTPPAAARIQSFSREFLERGVHRPLQPVVFRVSEALLALDDMDRVGVSRLLRRVGFAVVDDGVVEQDEGASFDLRAHARPGERGASTIPSGCRGCQQLPASRAQRRRMVAKLQAIYGGRM